MLRLEAGGPTSYVTSVALAPDGRAIYAGSWDKTVHVWRWDPARGEFATDPASWRVPIGPGLAGAINAIAVSPDGNWLAAAGKAVIGGEADFRHPGRIVPVVGGMTDEMRLDEGTIYVFDTRTRETHSLRGHRGEVRSLAFAPSGPNAPVLVSAAREWSSQIGQFVGVVRVWNVLADNRQPALQSLPVPQDVVWPTSPKLAVRRTGASPLDIEVAIAWGDNLFRVWDIARNRILSAQQPGQFQDTVVYDASADQFLAGSVGEDHSFRLRSWRVTAGGLAIDQSRSVQLPRQPDSACVPRSLAFASSTAGGPRDLLLAVVHRTFPNVPQRDQYELWLFRLPLSGARVQPVFLWRAGPPPYRVPQIAAVPGGEFVAVTKESDTHVFAIAELLASRATARVLQSAGAKVSQVSFVRQRGAEPARLGLRLQVRERSAPAARPVDSDLIFDLEQAALSEHAAGDGWSTLAPPAGDWRLENAAPVAPPRQPGTSQPAAARRQLAVFQGAQQRSTIELPAGHEPTGYAISASSRPPVIAIATHQNGLPYLNLFDAASGQPVRQLSAHFGLIRSLAFSDDGLLLASAADDEMVCLWRLADLDKIVGRHGMATGVKVRAADGGLTAIVDSSLAAPAGLGDGDLILGRVIGGQFLAWSSPPDFYDAFWNATPGEAVRLRVVRTGAAPREVALTVAQGIDERKPLLSLFITRGGPGEKRGWIAWSPLGPYQSSDEQVERYLGWHFNTGRPELPVAFAHAAAYREKYFREGLINTLIKTGEPPQKQAAAPLVRPAVDLIVDAQETGPAAASDEVVIHRPPTTANLVIADLPPDKIDKVELKRDGQMVGTLQRQPDGATWSVELDPASWQPGAHRLAAVIHTKEAEPQQFDIERKLRYQPPPPRVALNVPRGGPGGRVVDQPQTSFQATVEPAAPGEIVDVTLRRQHAGNEIIVKQWSTNQRLEINEMVPLDEGGNVLELVAKNRNALAGHEDVETQRQQLTVNFTKAPAVPIIASAKVEPLREGGGEAHDLNIGPAVTHVNRVRLTGEISSVQGPLEIETSLGKESVPVKIVPAAGGRPATFEAELALAPGENRVRLLPKAIGGPAIETDIRVEYRPPLPDLVIDLAEPQQTFVAGRDPATFRLAAQLKGDRGDHPFEATILVNGEPSPAKPAIDLSARTLTADIPLAAGENNIELLLTDAFNPPSIKPVARIRYVHLPTVEKVEVKNDQTPVLELLASGRSASPITAVEVSSDVLPASAVKYDQAAGTWQAAIRAPRRAEPYQIAISARNRDGKSLEPRLFDVPAWRPPQPPPTIDLPASGNITVSQFELRFTVRSKSKIRSISIKHDREIIPYAPNLDAIQPDPIGYYTFEGMVALQLEPGPNRLEVLAANEDGVQSESSIVNYIDPPARIVIDRLETIDRIPPTKLVVFTKETRAFVDGAAPGAKVLVHGRVEWPRSTDKTVLRRTQRLQVWVNGFQQAPADVPPPLADSLTSPFTAFAVLNQPKDNLIQISLPDLTPDIAAVTELTVDCARPVHEQRLHLLVIGVGVPPGGEETLKSQVLTAIRARPRPDGVPRTAAFDRVAIYGPIIGDDITPQQVRSQLALIKVKIDELYKTNQTSSRPANDVVMIYLQGGALVDAGGDFYVTTRPPTDPRTGRALRQREPRILLDVAVRSRTLADFLTHTAGAHVLMLDVTGDETADQRARWPEKSQAAMLRYTWLKDSLAPPKARLIAALPSAMQSSAKLAEVDAKLRQIYAQQAAEFPLSLSYNRRVPNPLQELVLGESLPTP